MRRMRDLEADPVAGAELSMQGIFASTRSMLALGNDEEADMVRITHVIRTTKQLRITRLSCKLFAVQENLALATYICWGGKTGVDADRLVCLPAAQSVAFRRLRTGSRRGAERILAN